MKIEIKMNDKVIILTFSLVVLRIGVT